MIHPSHDFLFLSIFIAGLSAAMLLYIEKWYFYPVIIILYIFLWYKTKSQERLVLPLFFSGLLASFASWFSSPWIAIVVFCLALGMFLFQLQTLKNQKDYKIFLFLSCIVTIFGYAVMHTNRVILPFFILTIISALLLFFTFIAELKLQKKFSGESK